MDFLNELLGSNAIADWLGELLRTDVAKMTIAFLIAARLHRQWVKKDVAEQLSTITAAINNVATKMSMALELHSKKIDELSVRVDHLETEIKPTQGG